MEHKRVRKHGEERVFTHVHIRDRFPIELTLYPADKAHYVFKSSITGKAIERASLRRVGRVTAAGVSRPVRRRRGRRSREPHRPVSSVPLPAAAAAGGSSRIAKWHPEGDVLYHSLQVFELARDELPYDEEFLLAALLHDVGKAIDPADHVQAALDALGETVTERTAWLIRHHMLAHALHDRTAGANTPAAAAVRALR